MLSITILAALLHTVSAQTYTSCNPLSAQCPADTALGKSITIDFTKGASDQFTTSGGGSPSYQSDGTYLTVAKQGDSPTFTSKWYMMFGRVEVKMKAAPGTGIVSSLVLQSDDLDEIDLEWIGGDATQVQSNYFGKGQTTSYTRGAFHANPNNHDWHTYSVDFTSQQVTWGIDGQTVRVLTPATAEANQFPQTPMQLKLGIWAGGDPSNNPGTISWAGGTTNYAGGPYSMVIASVIATDYSTGTSYTYSGTTGTWQSIKSNGGTIFSGSSGSGSSAASAAPSVSEAAPQTSSSSSSPPPPASSSSAVSTTSTSDPKAPATTTKTAAQAPPSTTEVSAQTTIAPQTQSGSVTTVVYDNKGFPTTIVVPSGWTKSYDAQGFVVLPTGSSNANKINIDAASATGGGSDGTANSGLSGSKTTGSSGAVTTMKTTTATTTTAKTTSSMNSTSTSTGGAAVGGARIIGSTGLLGVLVTFLLAL